MSEEEFVENMQETNDLLDDERSRTRGGFHHSQPGTNGITPESAQPTSSGDPGYDSFRVNKSQISGTAIQVIRSTVPHLAHLPDDYLASQPIDALIRANTAAKQADQSGTAKGADGRLNHNFQKAMANPVDITGTDNRSSILHPARFLPGAGVPAQRLWLEARKHLGPEGAQPIGNYDMKAVGCSGCVTAKGWEILHNPGSPEIALKLFTVANVSHVSTGSKTLTLTGEDGLTIHDSMKDVADMAEMKLALRTIREAASYAMPWNKSFSVLEGFLITHDFFFKELEGLKKVPVLSSFIDHVLKMNAANWTQEVEFLAGGELTAAWDSWLGSRKNCFKTPDNNNQHHYNQQKSNGSNNNFRGRGGNRGQGGYNQNMGRGGNNQHFNGGGFNQFPNQGQGFQQLPPHTGPPCADNICRRFNDGKCPNRHLECAVGRFRLYHRCNYMVKGQSGPAQLCLKYHPRVEHK